MPDRCILKTLSHTYIVIICTLCLNTYIYTCLSLGPTYVGDGRAPYCTTLRPQRQRHPQRLVAHIHSRKSINTISSIYNASHPRCDTSFERKGAEAFMLKKRPGTDIFEHKANSNYFFSHSQEKRINSYCICRN